MTTWVIWYEDGSSYSDDDGPPDKAPRDGVQVVTVSDVGTGRLMWHSSDYYCWHKEGEWVPHSKPGMERYLSKSDEPGIVLNGYAIPYRRWIEVYNKALADPRLPWGKVATDPREKPAPTE
jgi:hypothetical protein